MTAAGLAILLAGLAGWLVTDGPWARRRLAHLLAPTATSPRSLWGRPALRRVLHRFRGQRAEAAASAAVLELCTAVAAELRAGRTPAEALRLAASTAAEPHRAVFSGPAAAAATGGDVPRVLRTAASVPGCAALAWFAACWQVGAGTGAGLADAVERLAQGLRAEQRRRHEVRAQLAAPKATARLLAALPVLGVALGSGLGQRPLAFLLGTPYGVACLLVGLALNVAGLVWTGRIASKAEAA